MSRVGRKAIPCPPGVEVKLEGSRIEVKGPKGVLSRDLHPLMKVVQEQGQLRIDRGGDARRNRALHGLTRTLVANMIRGVTEGFEKRLEMVGLGYRAAVQGKKLTLHLGYSHPIVYEADEGVEVAVDAQNRNVIVVRGINKERVGQTAADIRRFRKPEPYKGKGVRYLGEKVRRKAGKTGVK
ncbi:MAG: 50S ribosomal protein L6 [Candidatus Tectomicrobia bacterium]|nr:50S ribosomal protein L6 [Candidatus Tectomicrobia bacterium]